MPHTENPVHSELLDWARGDNTLVAATQLLIDTNWLSERSRWVRRTTTGSYWIEFDAIPDLIGAYSGGEQRILRIAASLGGRSQVNLSDDISGLDSKLLDATLRALAHAAGYTPSTSIGEQ